MYNQHNRVHSGYFTFFAVVTVIASLNDYWQVLKLDVLLADPTQQQPQANRTPPTGDTRDDTQAEDPEKKSTATESVDNEPAAATENGNDTGETTADDAGGDASRKTSTCNTCNKDHGIRHHPYLHYSFLLLTLKLYMFFYIACYI